MSELAKSFHLTARLKDIDGMGMQLFIECTKDKPNLKEIEQLLIDGAPPDYANAYGFSSLMHVTWFYKPDVVPILLKYNADPFKKNHRWSLSAYDMAEWHQHTDIKNMFDLGLSNTKTFTPKIKGNTP